MSHAAPRSEPAEELRAVALRLFVETSYAGASLQQIADAAGYSKSSVLYHFASKEALLESALTPAVDKLGLVLGSSVGRIADEAQRAAFVEEFIDFLLEYKLEAHIIINQGQSLAGIPTMDRARDWITRLAGSFDSEMSSVTQRIRIGVGLAGAAYVLATTAGDATVHDSIDEVRAALIDVVSELVSTFSAPALSATAPATPNRLTP
ncbi:TetR/AcrR family transcriptional regulator [Subtercola endophyticus]|uniref:TetR/AcrR family transcriptional regulator n=1 Tax=Subtercola endophyticus TaxID=2895559 RepID=UPI001E62A69D|nr:TetR/AcrR family transcriptional regulator [Subtercola endophyticus]UFS58967.1 TetR/AcrR family transcriptional regulator [Subtercola endophyticus]